MDTATFDLRTAFGAVWRRKWSILLIVLVTAGSAAIFSFRRAPVYAATTEVQVTPLTASQVLNANQYGSYVNMANEVRVALSAPVASIASDTLGSELDTDELSVDVPTDTEILQFTYRDADPAVARDGAEAFATAFLTYRTTVAADTYARARSTIQRQIDELSAELGEARARMEAAVPGSTDQILARNAVNQTSSQISGLNIQLALLAAPGITPGSIIQPADLPEFPSSPNHRQDIALGLVTGLILAIGLAFLRERLDDGIHGRRDLEAAVAVPVLAVVPKIRSRRNEHDSTLVTMSDPDSPAAEAYRALRTNLRFIARDDTAHVVAVTSAHAGEGKTTAVANLAVALAHTERRVVAISTDLRRPRLHSFFGLDNEVGLSLVLSGQAMLLDVAHRVEGLESLRIITSGPVPPNPAELLSSDTMEALLDQLRETADYIVVDTAPILVVADALILAPRADAVLLVADADGTTKAAVAHAKEQLDQVGANVVGAVLNRFDASKARYYPSATEGGYYRYRYRSESDQAFNNGNGRAVREPEPEAEETPR